MARKRTIDPDFWTDEKVLALPWPAVAFQLGLVSHADDEGRLAWSAAQLHAKIAPGRPDVTRTDVEAWMSAIEANKLVTVYEVEGKHYAHHPAWASHQYVNKPQPSRIPPPAVTEHSGSGAVEVTSRPVPSDSVSVSDSLSDSYPESESDVPPASLTIVREVAPPKKITKTRAKIAPDIRPAVKFS